MKRNNVFLFITFILAAVFALGLLGATGSGIPVLTYHHVGSGEDWLYVSETDFEQQLIYLRKQGYTAISVAQLAAGLSGQVTLPARPVVLTFDDGYEDNYQLAIPVLLRQGMTASFFIVTGKMGQPGYMSWEQLKTMRVQGMEIGSHTVQHYSLSEINLKEMERELRASRLMLESNLPAATPIFANPFGETAPAVLSLLEKTGYKAACSSVIGLNRSGQNPFMIRRMSVPQSQFGLMDFRLRLWWLNLLDRLEM